MAGRRKVLIAMVVAAAVAGYVIWRSSPSARMASAIQIAAVSDPAPLAMASAAGEHAEPNWDQLGSIVSRELQRVLDRYPRLDGQSKVIHIRATVHPKLKKLTIVVDRGFVPTINGAELEDLQSLLTATALHLVDPVLAVGEVEFMCDGRPLSSYFSEEHNGRVDESGRPRVQVARSAVNY